MSDRFEHLWIIAADFAKSFAFYRDVLGWTVLKEWEDRGTGRGAILSGGGVKVVLSERDTATGTPASPPRLHLDIHDIDERFRNLPKGEHVLLEPHETQWGTRWFVLRDPDGNVIAFEELHGRGA
jgi:catechol 2,3-dioxygenase-like lactoylglutathione lyase family enzyme